MDKLKCPNCSQEMQTNREGGIVTEECPSCGGVFLERGELNAFATGMSGDIELCSLDNADHADTFSERTCPRCADQRMEKINMLRLSDIIFDHCPTCGGFFLDRDELSRMNRELAAMTPSHEAEEYRGTHNGHAVRIDQTNDVVEIGYLGISHMVAARTMRVSVFFKERMPEGFRLFQNSWPVRLAKGLGLFWGQDIETGDEAFDALFRVQGEDEALIARHFDAPAREALIAFANRDETVFGRHGTLEVTSTGTVYVEGPYDPKSIADVTEKAMPLIEHLVELVEAIEAVPA